MSMRVHMDAVNWVFSKDAITNYCFRTLFLFYRGYQRFFSRAAGIFGVGRRPTHLSRRCVGLRVTIQTWQKPETALEKSVAPRVFLFGRRPNRIIEIKPSDANVCYAKDSHKVKSMLKRKLPQCLVPFSFSFFAPLRPLGLIHWMKKQIWNEINVGQMWSKYKICHICSHLCKAQIRHLSLRQIG